MYIPQNWEICYHLHTSLMKINKGAGGEIANILPMWQLCLLPRIISLVHNFAFKELYFLLTSVSISIYNSTYLRKLTIDFHEWEQIPNFHECKVRVKIKWIYSNVWSLITEIFEKWIELCANSVELTETILHITQRYREMMTSQWKKVENIF